MTTTAPRRMALRRVRAAARRLEHAEQAFETSLRDAATVAPQRAIADAAGRSLTRTNQIIHGRNR
jgi:hypothetical protein